MDIKIDEKTQQEIFNRKFIGFLDVQIKDNNGTSIGRRDIQGTGEPIRTLLTDAESLFRPGQAIQQNGGLPPPYEIIHFDPDKRRIVVRKKKHAA